MNRMSWAAYAAMFTVVGALVLALAVDWKIRSDDPMEEHHAMQANDRAIACAMRIHTLEQEQDMLRLRVEELEERHESLEEMVYGFHPTNKTVKDASQWTCVYHNWTGDEDD